MTSKMLFCYISPFLLTLKQIRCKTEEGKRWCSKRFKHLNSEIKIQLSERLALTTSTSIFLCNEQDTRFNKYGCTNGAIVDHVRNQDSLGKSRGSILFYFSGSVKIIANEYIEIGGWIIVSWCLKIKWGLR